MSTNYLLRENGTTLKDQAKQFLLGEIQCGQMKPGDFVPTVKDLATVLNVSTKIAFSAIQELREEGWLEKSQNRRHLIIDDAPKKMLFAKGLVIGFSSRGSDHIHSWPYQAIYNHLVQLSRETQSELPCFLEMGQTGIQNPTKPFDAFIVTDWAPENIRQLCSGPVIAVESWSGIKADYTVKTDHFKGGAMMARHLYQKGNRRVVYWGLSEKSPGKNLKGIAYRRIGFLKGWLDVGGDPESIKVVHVSDNHEEMKSSVREHLKETEAFYVFADKWALRIWAILEELGVKVPDDIHLAGYDGLYEAMSHQPSLTTVKQNFKEIARQTLELIVHNLTSDQGNQKEFCVKPELFIGQTL